MTRPPRSTSASPFDVGNLGYAVIQGMGITVVLLLGYGAFIGRGFSETKSRAAVFAGLVLGLFLIVLSNCNLSRSAIAGLAAADTIQTVASLAPLSGVVAWLAVLRRVAARFLAETGKTLV